MPRLPLRSVLIIAAVLGVVGACAIKPPPPEPPPPPPPSASPPATAEQAAAQAGTLSGAGGASADGASSTAAGSGSFDACLRKQQQKIALERDARQATIAGSTVSTTSDGTPKPAADAAANASGNGALANEVPDGNDDDIVARRLRKAAEQETDPELKDKLWKEYVEYKKYAQQMTTPVK